MLDRRPTVGRVVDLLQRWPVVGIVGARQVGKTTLAGLVAARVGGPVHRFDMEHPHDLARLSDPVAALASLQGLVIVDEAQHLPGLFPVLRVLADRPGSPARFLILGSASPLLVQGGSESLAGRIVWHEIPGFSLSEVGVAEMDRLWVRGGFPKAFLANDDAAAHEWLLALVETVLTRDLPQLEIRVPTPALRRFWMMLAHYHGRPWNAADFARGLGVGEATARRYLDWLSQALVVEALPPWFENVGKRQTKAPRIYLRDPGVLHTLLGVGSLDALLGHPAAGPSWEGLCISEVRSVLGARREDCWYWRTHTGAELDLLVVRGSDRIGFEMKCAHAPALTPSMRIAMRDLRLDRLLVLHRGTERYPLGDRIEAVPLARLAEAVGAAATPGPGGEFPPTPDRR